MVPLVLIPEPMRPVAVAGSVVPWNVALAALDVESLAGELDWFRCHTPLKLVSQVPLTFWVGVEMVASPYLTTIVWFDDAETVFSAGICTQAITCPVVAV